MLHYVALVKTDVSDDCSASIIRVTRIGELGTLAVTSNQCMLVTANIVPSSPILVTLMMEALQPSEKSVLTTQKMAFFKYSNIRITTLNIKFNQNMSKDLEDNIQNSIWPLK
jgi:hypothetical protein